MTLKELWNTDTSLELSAVKHAVETGDVFDMRCCLRAYGLEHSYDEAENAIDILRYMLKNGSIA